MHRFILTSTMLLAFCAGAAAGPATEAVRFFYQPIRFEGDPEFRDRFVDAAKTVFDLNDAAAKNPDNAPCIDFNPGLDAQDYDEGEVAKSLSFAETANDDTADVTAKFNVLPGRPRRRARGALDDEAGRSRLEGVRHPVGEWSVAPQRIRLQRGRRKLSARQPRPRYGATPVSGTQAPSGAGPVCQNTSIGMPPRGNQ